MAKTKLIYIIGSIIIGLVSVIGVFFILIAAGIISTERDKLVLVSASAQKEYDGTALVCQEWAIAEGQLKEGHVMTVTMVGDAIEVGEYANTFTVTINDSVGADVTDDYTIEMNYGTLTILKRAIRVRTASAEKYYDDTLLTDGGWELLPDCTVVEGQTLMVSPTGAIKNVGEVANSAYAAVLAGDRLRTRHLEGFTETDFYPYGRRVKGI